MARVTVEDCIEKVKNRFELVLMAAKRAKDLDKGAMPSVAKDNDKSTIIALREIADEAISLDGLRELAKRSTYDGVDPFTDHEEKNNEITVEEMMLDSDINEEDDEDDELDEEDIKALDDLDDALDEEKD